MTAICKSLSPRCSSLQLLTGDLNWLSIHGPHLEWTPAPERSSGQSTPNSMTLIVHKSVAPGKTFAESEKDMSHPVNCKNTHCWGYIQGLCPFTVPAADLSQQLVLSSLAPAKDTSSSCTTRRMQVRYATTDLRCPRLRRSALHRLLPLCACAARPGTRRI